MAQKGVRLIFFIVVKFSIINIPLSGEAVMYLHVVFRVVSMLA